MMSLEGLALDLNWRIGFLFWLACSLEAESGVTASLRLMIKPPILSGGAL